MKVIPDYESSKTAKDPASGKLLLIRAGADKILSLLLLNGRLLSVKVYSAKEQSLVGNIYIGKVTGIPAGLQAAFVDIAPGVSCFLPLNDAPFPLHTGNRGEQPNLHPSLHPGDEVLVQVVRDAVKTKQPVVSGRLSISGSYLAAKTDSADLNFSNKLSVTQKKHLLKILMEQELVSPERQCLSSCGMIVRTNAGSLTEAEPLLSEWHLLSDKVQELLTFAPHRSCYSCLYRNATPYVEDIKNYYSGEFSEILTDCKTLYTELSEYEQAQERAGMPHYPVRLYQDTYPLYKLYQLETRLNQAFSRRIWLASGANLVIEYTEALTVVDVNSGKNEKENKGAGKILSINLEAAEEILRQMRLRNLSGIIIVDFINMEAEEDREVLLKHMRSLCKADPVKTSIVDMTPLGLVEITRKRISRPLYEILSPQDIQVLEASGNEEG